MRHRGVSPLAVWETVWKSGLITLELEVSVQVHLAPQEKASTLRSLLLNFCQLPESPRCLLSQLLLIECTHLASS